MDWYVVIKTIKGHRYRYQQRTWREGRQVRTESRYVGPADAPRVAKTGKEVRVGDTVTWPAWRVESGYQHDRGATAWDVLTYEIEDLGNEYLRPQVELVCTRQELRRRPANGLVWVTQTAAAARRYGKAVKRLSLPVGSRVIAKDRAGGLLILCGS